VSESVSVNVVKDVGTQSKAASRVSYVVSQTVTRGKARIATWIHEAQPAIVTPDISL
jgi:hypothetical protein